MSAYNSGLNGSHGTGGYMVLSPNAGTSYGNGQIDFYIRNNTGAYTFPNNPNVPSSYWMSSCMTIRSDFRVGINDSNPGSTLDVNGSLSKNSGSFKISHPLAGMSTTHNLVHSFIEGPRADLIYRGEVRLVSGIATVVMDQAVGLTTGTWELLCRDPDVFVTNNEDWTPVKAGISSTGVLTIQAQDAACTAKVNWLVVAERHDPHMYDTEWTDDDGRVILEPLKPEPRVHAT